MANARKKARKAHSCRLVREDLIAQLADVEGEDPRLAIHVVHDGHDRDQHEQAADQREQEELDGGVDLPWATPDPDDEVHRDEHGLPEHVEEEEVGGAEHARHADLQQEQRDEEAHLAVLHVVPACDDDDEAQQRGEEDQQGGDAVDAEAVVDVEALHPDEVLDELQALRAGVEAEHHDRGQHEGGQRHGQRDDLVDGWAAAADKQDEHHAGERQST